MTEKVSIQLELVSELRGSIPEIALAEGINYEQLVAADIADGRQPMFVTLPIAQFGQVSRNQRRYPEAEIRRMYKRIMQNAVTGDLGHMRLEDRSHKFEVPAIKWVGAEIVEDKLWAKFYVLAHREDVREYMRVQKASNGPVGTSLYALAYENYNEDEDVYEISGIELEQIDIVHPDRVGVLMAATHSPHITVETIQETEGEQDPNSDKLSRTTSEEDAGAAGNNQRDINTQIEEAEMSTATQVPVDTDNRIVELQEAHDEQLRDINREMTVLKKNARTFQRLCEMLAVSDGDDPVLALQARLVELEAAQKENRELLSTAIESEVSKHVVVDYVRGTVIEMVAKMHPQTRAEVTACVAEALKNENIQSILKHAVQVETGPALTTPSNPSDNNNRADDNMYVIMPDA